MQNRFMICLIASINFETSCYHNRKFEKKNTSLNCIIRSRISTAPRASNLHVAVDFHLAQISIMFLYDVCVQVYLFNCIYGVDILVYCFQFECLMVKYLINLHVRLLHANLKPNDFQKFQLHRKNTQRQKLIWMLELFYSRPATAAAVKKKYRLRAHLFVVYSVQMYNVQCTCTYVSLSIFFSLNLLQSLISSASFRFWKFYLTIFYCQHHY